MGSGGGAGAGRRRPLVIGITGGSTFQRVGRGGEGMGKGARATRVIFGVWVILFLFFFSFSSFFPFRFV